MSILDPVARRSTASSPGFERMVRSLTTAEFSRHVVAIRAALEAQTVALLAGTPIVSRDRLVDPARGHGAAFGKKLNGPGYKPRDNEAEGAPRGWMERCLHPVVSRRTRRAR